MDLKFAFRQFVKSPAFTLIAVVTLAFGIGANTAIFSFVNSWIIRPLPYPDPDRLVVLYEKNRQTGRESPTAPADWADWNAWRDQSGVFKELALYDFNVYNLTGEGDPIQLAGQSVSSNFFRTLGVVPALGRDFTVAEQEPGAPRVAILSYELWRDRFGLDRAVLQKTIQIDGAATTIVGVMPETFHFSLMGRAKLWTPFTMSADVMANRNARYLQTLGRLKKGLALGSARAAMDAFQSGLSKAYPATNANRGVAMRDLHEEMGREAGNEPLLIIFGIVCFILLMACANVANLILARSSSRRKEIAVRLAIGAGRWRLVRQLLTETLLLFVCGALGGAFLARLGAHALTNLIPFRNRGYLPNYGVVEVDGSVLLFALGVALLTGLIFGLAPALEGTGFDINAALKDGGARGTTSKAAARFRKTLVGGEVALAVIVVVCAVLLINTFVNILSVDPGFRGDRVLAATVELPSRYKGMAGVTQFFDQVIERLAGVPGVERASASQATPIIGGGTIRPVLAEGRPEPQPGQERTAHMGSVTPGYLESMSIPLLSGRTIARSDTADTQPVAMIGETLAAREFGGENPLGRKIRLGARDWYQVIGVVKDIHYYRVTEPVESEAYVAFSQAPSRAMSVVVRTAGDPSSAAAAIRAAVRAVDPNQAVSKVETISTLMEEINAPQRILTQISSFFGALALFLAAIGIYGVMAYAVAERTQEIGVRMALGAQRGDVLRLIFRQSAGMLGGGMIVGLAAAFALARVMHNFLFGVRPTDPVTFLSAAVILAAVAALACWIPARRAAGVDPVIALRHE